MTLRRRLTMLAAGAVAIAIIVAAVGAYIAVRNALRDQVDDSLRGLSGLAQERVTTAGTLPGVQQLEELQPPQGADLPVPPPDGASRLVQLLPPGGQSVTGPPGAPTIPVSDADRAIAGSGEGTNLEDVTVGGEPFRLLTVGVGDAGAIQLGASLGGVDDVLANLRVILVIICLAGIGVAALVARLLAQRVLAPIAQLTDAAEHVASTDDLSQRIAVDRTDEVGRLATRFNEMLAAIERSQDALTKSLTAQSHLIADTSHELRTPIAGLRTEVESLIDHPELREEERSRRLVAAGERIEELTALVGDVIELARGDQPGGAAEDVRLDEVVAHSVARLRRHAPEREVLVDLAESVVEGRPDRISRAINNLLDNAHKYSPAGEPIEVTVADHSVTVRDHGPGIGADELEHVFDRFWRGAGSREITGSGLGLAIVRQVAESQGGSVSAAAAEDGGTVFTLRLG